MVVAMVDGGDAIGDADVVAAAARPLEEMAGAGLVVVVGWPALVPRLQATVARWDGRYGNARRHLEHALAVCDANVLRAEGARVQLEVAQLAVAEHRPAADVSALFGAVLRRFDELDMHGWTRRCDELVQALGLAASAGLGRGVRERTFLTTDIVGSTAANARMGNALYLEQLRVHDRLVTARIREHRGQTIKHTGDGLNACFDGAGDAVRCALAVRDDIVRWRADEPDLALPVRFGIARGPVIASGGDYFGLAQSETARLCALAGAEEIVASAAVVEQVDLPGLVLTDLGLQELRGLPTATRAFLLAR
jgi:class 3 adenylate cyclase